MSGILMFFSCWIWVFVLIGLVVVLKKTMPHLLRSAKNNPETTAAILRFAARVMKK